MQLKKNFITIEGIKLIYYTGGTGRTVLFLHGGRIRALTFKKNLELLSKRFHVIAPDIPGYGDSSTPSEVWSLKEYAQFFKAFLKEMKLKNVIVIGYSLGGGIALYLSEQSSLITNLIVIDPAGLVNGGKNLFIPDMKRFIFYLTHPQYVSTLVLLLKDYLLYLTRHIADVQQTRSIRYRSGIIGYRAVKQITIPMLILWGKEDWFFPVAYGEKLHREMPKSKLEIVSGNHDWIVYNPELFIEKINTWLLPKNYHQQENL